MSTLPRPSRSAVYLSKSKYLHGLQCPKLLWYEYNRKAAIPPPDPVTQLAFDEGQRVGRLAQELYPDGVRVERLWDPEKQHERSVQMLKLGKPLFEAGFIYQRAYALADILVPAEEDRWDLIEVKSSTGVKEEHFHDAAFQLYTYEGAGVKIDKCYVMYVNGDYVRRGKIEPDKFFLREDIARQSRVLMQKIGGAVNSMLGVVAGKKEPDIRIGPHCRSPRDCPLQDVCWSFLPEKDSIFVLYSGGKRSFELLEEGIDKLTDIPDDYKLSYKQVIQVEAHRLKKAYIDREALREFLKRACYPLYFLDFETIRPAIPVYDLTRPHEPIPFQYSLNVVAEEGARPVHHSYLAPGESDPRPEVLKQLREFIGREGSIVAYNASFEKICLKRAAEAFPEYREWAKGLSDRFLDLLEPFQRFNYYHPAQAGSASLKSVLPAVTGESYEGMEIAEGGTASAEYYRATFGSKVSEQERGRVRKALEDYCKMDTMGMVRILEELKKKAKEG